MIDLGKKKKKKAEFYFYYEQGFFTFQYFSFTLEFLLFNHKLFFKTNKRGKNSFLLVLEKRGMVGLIGPQMFAQFNKTDFS